MMPTPTLADVVALGPILAVGITALLALLIETVFPRSEKVSAGVSIFGLVVAGVLAAQTLGVPGAAFGGQVLSGGFASYFALLFGVCGILTIMVSTKALGTLGMERGEYYALLLLGVLGMMIMAASGDLIIFFVGLETMSIAFYVLAGFARRRATSNEAALKYFLLGSFATGFLLYGISLVYGATGTTGITAIRGQMPSLAGSPLFLIGLGLLVVGFLFKVAAVPFHMWVPDTYEGSPTPISGFMSTGGKAAAFSIFLLVFAPDVLPALGPVREAVAIVAAASMILGNIVALAQTSVKRMLAYSSIAHAGYILTGVVGANTYGAGGVLYYLLAYTFMNIGAFGTLALLESEQEENIRVETLAGLSGRMPLMAALLSVFMFSLAGIPPFAGFFGKYYVFAGAVEAGFTWLAILGVVMSVVSAYFYLRIVVQMYFRDEEAPFGDPVPAIGRIALMIAATMLLLQGLFPSAVLAVTSTFF